MHSRVQLLLLLCSQKNQYYIKKSWPFKVFVEVVTHRFNAYSEATGVSARETFLGGLLCCEKISTFAVTLKRSNWQIFSSPLRLQMRDSYYNFMGEGPQRESDTILKICLREIPLLLCCTAWFGELWIFFLPAIKKLIFLLEELKLFFYKVSNYYDVQQWG